MRKSAFNLRIMPATVSEPTGRPAWASHGGRKFSQSKSPAATAANNFETLLESHASVADTAVSTMKTFTALLLFAFATSAHGRLAPMDLRCDYAANPLGVDTPQPRLFWKLSGSGQNQTQAAYEIIAASSKKNLANNHGDLWSSGKMISDETIQILYAGKKRTSSQPVFWKVRVWDEAGNISAWSHPATWTMGILNSNNPPSSDFGAAGWHAQWIGAADTNIPSLLLRREFLVRPGLKRALVNVCGLGQYEFTLNGKTIEERSLVAAKSINGAGILGRAWDSIKLLIQ